MFVLSAMCVLLPLVTALETCDDSKTAAILAKDQLDVHLLDNFGNKKFWFAAVSTEGAGTSQSIEASFDSVSANSIPIHLIYRAADGTTTMTIDSTYTVDGDHILSGTHHVYYFQCSTNLMAAYRCLGEDATGGFGPTYFVWAEWDKSEDVVSAELDRCEAMFGDVDTSAAFLRRTHP